METHKKRGFASVWSFASDIAYLGIFTLGLAVLGILAARQALTPK